MRTTATYSQHNHTTPARARGQHSRPTQARVELREGLRGGGAALDLDPEDALRGERVHVALVVLGKRVRRVGAANVGCRHRPLRKERGYVWCV